MGCDIHLVLEKQVDNKWVGVDTFQGHHRAKWALKENEYDWSSSVARSRNYRRFAALAGVRGYGPSPKGLPNDASDTSLCLSNEWGCDGHSHSWLMIKEAYEIWKQTEGDLDSFADKHPISYFFGVDVSEGSNNKSEYRIVFWFDN